MNNRGAEYKELKQAFIDTCLESVMDIFPKITQDKVTPFSRHKGRTTVSFNEQKQKLYFINYKMWFPFSLPKC